MQNFLLAARTQGLGACLTSWSSYGGEAVLREELEIPDERLLAGHAVVGWPKGRHGPVRRRPLGGVVYLDRWGAPATAIAGEPTPDATTDVLHERTRSGA